MTEPAIAHKRVLAVAACAVGAACLIYAAFTSGWLVNSGPNAEIGFGLRTNFQCVAEICGDQTNAELVSRMRGLGVNIATTTSRAFAPTGWITFIDLLLVAVSLLAAGGLAAVRKQPQLPLTPSSLAMVCITIGLIAGCVFVATKPGPSGVVGVGPSFWLFGAGCLLGVVGAQLTAKLNRPPDPDLLEGSMNPDDY